MNKKYLLAFSSLALAFSSSINAKEQWLHCGQLLDVNSGKIVKDQWLQIQDNTIGAIVSSAPKKTDNLISLKDKTCLPGLMDMHVHLDGEMNPKAYIEEFILNPADLAYRAHEYAQRTLNAGFTTVRNPGDSYNVTISLRNAINQGWVQGPRIFSAGKAIGTTGGHADPTNGYNAQLVGDPGPKQGVVNSVEDAKKAVRQRYKDGADFIKITATGGVLSLAKSGQNPQFTKQEVQAVIDTAQDYGMHVAAHAHGKEGMLRAVNAGITTIEHGTYMDKEVMQAMKKMGTYYVPTILAGKFVAEKSKIDGYFPEIVRPKAAAVGPQIQKTFEQAYQAGVKIAFGTDSGVSAHGDNGKEFAYMVEVGMPALEAIQSATLTPAKILDIDHQLGSLEVGKLADIIAVDNNPLEDITSLQNVTFVMKDGQIIKQ
ncbi:amidohydrolase family protein [Kangiella sp. TOML190]|uniref:metal-dependent hydrolase family protein n=1 Tax=Kangiella sp. TOML190 TaxID=2931351 RepID=UPI002040D2F7|nr:amidohydrolase family protein [Kangiella sp. TOML190]